MRVLAGEGAALDAAAGSGARAPGGGVCLSDLIAGASSGARLVHGSPGVRVRAVCCDSRSVRPGDLFVALVGERSDGAAFVGEACARGAAAVAIAVQRTGEASLASCPALVACAEPRPFAAEAAACLAGHPSHRMTVVAVTGTSGKTTTTYLLASMLAAAGHAPGVVGTIEYRWPGHREKASLTTPDGAELQGMLARMRESGTTHVAMEASSHALALDRLHATACDAAVFTNFSRDHLDYHVDMEHYLAAKRRLFLEILPASGKPSFAVLNAEDETVMKLAPEIRAPVVTFGRGGGVRCERLEASAEGTRGTLALGTERLDFASRLIGAPHVSNILCAAATAWRLGVPREAIAAGIATCRVVPGRLESVSAGQPFQVVVDYAHKPDALERTLASLRGLARGRLIAVLGCGGDRDPGKRPLMGAIAARLAEVSILTSDNPRTEDPVAILSAIEEGVRREGRTLVAQEALGQVGSEGVYAVVPERRAAIRCAIDIAREGDLVVIAGKGHEDYQIVGATRVHLDDREEARAALAARSWEGATSTQAR